ncbi:MAG: LD-carboxypeptidase [Acetatifactor sp.]|nr:LD-carboxypeptidase [Acetatifactor sp.]
MRFPKFLEKGGSIGFMAPSFGCATEPYLSVFHNARKKLEELGYRTVPGPNCYESAGVGISNTPEKCGSEVMEMFGREDVDCLISCGGGELMCEILPYVDFEKLADMKPKWFMGYSDNTNLTYLLATLADTASVYGPCAGAFGMEPWHEALKDAFGVLTGERKSVHGYELWERESLKDEAHPLVPYNVTEPVQLRSFVGREEISFSETGTRELLRFSGRLLGGCLDCLVNLSGTRFDKTMEFAEKYKDDGIIWFLEACDLNVFAIRRAMWQLEETGWFRHVKGFLIGRPLNGGEMMGLDAYDAVLEVAGRKGVPVIMDVDLGHLPPMMPLIVGSLAEVTLSGNSIQVEMKTV